MDKNLFEALSPAEGSLDLQGRLEALLFCSSRPLSPQQLREYLLPEPPSLVEVQRALRELVEYHGERRGGFVLVALPQGYQFRTVQEAAPWVESLLARRQRPLSRAAQETLAIVAYRQPVTRAGVEFIRGVESGNIFRQLMERDLIRCVGRKEEAGRPMLFGTTGEFLRVYGLKDLEDLPPLSSFQPAREKLSSALEKVEEGEELDVELDILIPERIEE